MRFEYRIVSVTVDYDDSTYSFKFGEFEKTLNQMGDDGWELVDVVGNPNDSDYRLFFKRQIIDGNKVL